MKIKEMLKLGGILAVFAAAACVMLAFVYTGTQKIIAERKESDKLQALEDIFPDADDYEEISISEVIPGITIDAAYKAVKDGETSGLIIALNRNGYSGPIKLMTGVTVDGIITGVKILEQTETPGLGSNAASGAYYVNRDKKITFYGQFTGKSAEDRFEVNNDVQGITASTITSRAVSSAVKAACIAAVSWMSGGPLSEEDIDSVSGASIGGSE